MTFIMFIMSSLYGTIFNILKIQEIGRGGVLGSSLFQ